MEKERERESRRYSSRAKKPLSLSLSSQRGPRTGPGRAEAGPLLSAVRGAARSRLVSVTNDAACSPLDVTRYQPGRSSLTRAGAGTLARRDSAERSRYDSRGIP